MLGGIEIMSGENAPMLTDKAISQAKPQEKPYRLYDQHGLYLEVSPAGGKLWRLKYRIEGKEKRLALGKYPAISLKEAREKTFEARKVLVSGIDPGKTKEAEEAVAPVFHVLAKEWWCKFMMPNKGGYPAEVWGRLEREVFPFIGNRQIDAITAPDVLAILHRIEERGTITAAHKVKSYISQTFKYAIACGHVLMNPARDLAGALSPVKSKPMAAITEPRAVGALMRAIDGYSGGGVVHCALKLSALTFLRPGELRCGLWSGIDFDTAEWRLSADEMKMKRPYIVPLSTQALDTLGVLHKFSGQGKYMFPSIRTLARPISDMTVGAALRALGYSGEMMTPHGFRAMATSLLSERGWSVEVIERQLAHVEGNKVKAAYHRSEHLEERRQMMQAWADYLDQLKANSLYPNVSINCEK